MTEQLAIAAPYAILEGGAGPFSERQHLALRRMVAAYGDQATPALADTAVWDAEFYGLTNSSLFSALSVERQQLMLRRSGLGIMQEAQLIEVAGTTFTAKMSLLADTLVQRELYSLFAADEARHLRLFSQLIGEPEAQHLAGNYFLKALAEMIQTEAAPVLVLMIQVLLEGWGIRYYGALARYAKDPHVSAGLKSIVDDEAKHHGSGLILHQEERLTKGEQQRLVELAGAFLDMVRLGPLTLVSHLAQVAGGISGPQLQTFLEESASGAKIASDLELIATLLQLAGAKDLHAHFSARGAFVPPSPVDCRRQLAAALGVAP